MANYKNGNRTKRTLFALVSATEAKYAQLQNTLKKNTASSTNYNVDLY
jgi:hypothetical protein